MNDMVKYVREAQDTFQERDICEADILVFCRLSYLRYPDFYQSLEGAALREVYRAELFDEVTEHVNKKEQMLELMTVLAASRRFRNVRAARYVSHFDKENVEQFSAITFFIDEKTAFIAYRGTDATYVGWREDFYLTFECPIPAQLEAMYYLESVSAGFSGQIYVAGHSKGGNLAVYAAAMTEDKVRQKIEKVYSLDGPGFVGAAEQAAVEHIRDKIVKYVPEFSIVGMLMENSDHYRIIESDGFAHRQHDTVSWKLEGNDFVYGKELTAEAVMLRETLNGWLDKLDREERVRIVDTLFDILESADTGEGMVNEIRFMKQLPEYAKEWKQLDKEDKQALMNMLGKLIVSGKEFFKKDS